MMNPLVRPLFVLVMLLSFASPSHPQQNYPPFDDHGSYDHPDVWVEKGYSLDYPTVTLRIIEAKSHKRFPGKVSINLSWPARIGNKSNYYWSCEKGERFKYFQPTPHNEINFKSPYYIIPTTGKRPLCIELYLVDSNEKSIELVYLHKGQNTITIKLKKASSGRRVTRDRDLGHIQKRNRELSGELAWDLIEGSHGKDMLMRQVNLGGIPEIELIGVYRNNGNPLMEIKIWGYDFSILYSANDKTIWGLIFPGAIAGGDSFGMYTNDNIAINRKGISRVQYGSKEQWDIDQIRIRHYEATRGGWCPLTIDYYPVSGSIVDGAGKVTPMFQKSYHNIITFGAVKTFSGMLDPRMNYICVKQFKWKGNRTWSERKCIELHHFGFKDTKTDIWYGISSTTLNAWRLPPGVKPGPGMGDTEKLAITLREGNPVDHKLPQESILRYDDSDSVHYYYSE